MSSAVQAVSPLAAPPRPPIPDLTRPLSPDALETALRGFHGSYYAEHPFHRLMYGGKLSRRQFQGSAANRLAYRRVVPRKDAAILSNCPDPDVRREWIQRIVDHDGTRPRDGPHRVVDPPGHRPRRTAGGDGRRAPRAARRPADLRELRLVLQVEALGPGLRVVTHRAVCTPDSPGTHRVLSHPLSLDSARRGWTTSRAAWCRLRGMSATAFRSCSGTALPPRPSGWLSRPWRSSWRCSGP